MNYDVRFHNIFRVIDGVAYPTRVGVGTDGTLWLDPEELGIQPEEVKNMMSYPGTCPLVLLVREERRIFVNAQALAGTQADPEIRKAMAATTNLLLSKLPRTQVQHDTLRDN